MEFIRKIAISKGWLDDKKNLFDIESYMKRKGKARLSRNTVITIVGIL